MLRVWARPSPLCGQLFAVRLSLVLSERISLYISGSKIEIYIIQFN